MKINNVFTRLLVPAAVMGLALCSPVSADDDDTPLGKSMHQASKALKSLRKIEKNDWDAGAKAARSAADGIRKGMAYIPALVEEMPDGMEKTKAIADYRRLMGLSYAALCELELAYLEKDQAKVDAAMKNVKAGKKEGHKKYEDD
ncbi:MAG: hypothetical protein KJO79_07355 [Verrucomicrobiae bacterium]|nr:hypothetical protein [Verrucomicrobiae bacterium]NNJ86977.1 hypothetical protein [Akkermansiaceae bacterium]